MTRQAGTRPEEPIREGKYARIERERRFLLAGPPPAPAVTARRRITDRYLPGTRLRLRRIDDPDSGDCEFKFTQKVPAGRPGFIQGLITNTYLSAGEYDLLASPRSPMTPGSPEAASSGLAVTTCLPGSPSTASNPSRPSEFSGGGVNDRAPVSGIDGKRDVFVGDQPLAIDPPEARS